MRFELVSTAEVTDLDLHIWPKKYILYFEISMHDPILVQINKSRQQLFTQNLALNLCEDFPPLQHCGKARMRTVLHQQKDKRVIMEEIEKSAYIGMVHLLVQLYLMHKQNLCVLML